MPYSPWQQDAQAFGNLGNAMNRAIIGLAQARARQGQNMQMLAIRQALEQAQQQHYNTQDDELLQRIAESKASMSAAQKLHDAVRAQNMPPVMMQQFNTLPGIDGSNGPDPANVYSVQAPVQDQAGVNLAEVEAAKALVKALHGQLVDPIHASANSLVTDTMTGRSYPGPIVLSPGSMYDLGGQQTVNERPFFGGQGQMPFNRQGQPTGPQVPFNPRPLVPPASSPSATIEALKNVLQLNTQYPGSLGTTNTAPFTDALLQAVTQLSSNGQTNLPPQSKQLTPDLARQFLQQAGGDKDKARQMARDAGYTF